MATARNSAQTQFPLEGKVKPVRAAKAKPRAAFASKKQPPAVGDFSGNLDPADAKRFEGARAFLIRQKTVVEEIFYYGSLTGWGLRYLANGAPLCALLLIGRKAIAVVALTSNADDEVDWSALSEPTQQAKLAAARTESEDQSTFWLDVPLDARGHNDLRVLVKARLTTDAAAD